MIFCLPFFYKSLSEKIIEDLKHGISDIHLLNISEVITRNGPCAERLDYRCEQGSHPPCPPRKSPLLPGCCQRLKGGLELKAVVVSDRPEQLGNSMCRSESFSSY